MVRYLQNQVVRQLFLHGQPRSYAKNEIVVQNDDTSDWVYFIDTGYVKIYSLSDDGDQHLHIILGPGELFPILTAFLGTHMDFIFCETLTPCTLWTVSRGWFLRSMHESPRINYALMMQLANQFRVFVVRVDNLEHKKARERVAYRILFMASRFGVHTDDGVIIEAPLTHEVIANSINLARESFSREIEKLVENHIVSYDQHQITVHDVEALIAAAGHPASDSFWFPDYYPESARAF